jgi:acyl-CoA thioesterase I
MDGHRIQKSIRNMLKYCFLLVLFIIGFQESIAQSAKARIACIGNSITFGARTLNPDLESYPAVLSDRLNSSGYVNYQVKNLGIGGATMIRFGTPNVWKSLDSLKSFPPDIVIIEVGTNETVSAGRHNWEHIQDFEKDYSDFLRAIREINPKCNFILCSPLDMVIATDSLSQERKKDLEERRPRIWQLRKKTRKIARKEGAFFLDLTSPFKGKTYLMTVKDGVHPNKDGYNYMATLIYDFLVKRRIVVK